MESVPSLGSPPHLSAEEHPSSGGAAAADTGDARRHVGRESRAQGSSGSPSAVHSSIEPSYSRTLQPR